MKKLDELKTYRNTNIERFTDENFRESHREQLNNLALVKGEEFVNKLVKLAVNLNNAALDDTMAFVGCIKKARKILDENK